MAINTSNSESNEKPVIQKHQYVNENFIPVSRNGTDTFVREGSKAHDKALELAFKTNKEKELVDSAVIRLSKELVLKEYLSFMKAKMRITEQLIKITTYGYSASDYPILLENEDFLELCKEVLRPRTTKITLKSFLNKKPLKTEFLIMKKV